MSKKHKKVCMTLNYIENFLILVSEGYGEWLTSNSWEHLKFISLNNHPYQAGPTLFNINSYETLFVDLLLVLISVVEIVTLLMIHMLE